MSDKHIHVCDNCNRFADSIVTKSLASYHTFFNAPKNWTTISGYDVCSRKCGREMLNKLEKDVSETPTICCHGCNK